MREWLGGLVRGTRVESGVLQALADLAEPDRRPPPPVQIPVDAFAWLPASAVTVLRSSTFGYPPALPRPPSLFSSGGKTSTDAVVRYLGLDREPEPTAMVTVDPGVAEKLRTIDRIRPDQYSLRVGWLFVAGTRPGPDGGHQRVFHPLVTRPVKVERHWPVLRPAGAVALTPLITEPGWRASLVGGGSSTGRAGVTLAEIAAQGFLGAGPHVVAAFAANAAAAAGLAVHSVRPVDGRPLSALLASPTLDVVVGVGVFAVDEVLGPPWAPELRLWDDRRLRTWTGLHSLYLPKQVRVRRGTPEPVETPYWLTPRQRAAVDEARRAEVTVVAGAPGTGKSQVLAALAADAVSRGRSVLVTARTDATIDALIDLFDRADGPDPVIFGDWDRRLALAERLERQPLPCTSDAALEACEQERDDAVRRAEDRRLGLVEVLRTVTGVAAVADARHLLWEELWSEWRDAVEAVRAATGSWMAAEATSQDRHPTNEAQVVALLIEALRAPRELRRSRIAAVWQHDLRRLLPLWVGTLRDIDELLPQIAGLFDLVIFDEANAIDQTEAAPALLRAFDVVVAGDPRQLHHLSFLSRADVTAVLRRRDFDSSPHTAARLDVRANSLFDAAAMVAPVHHLDEHFRSDPPLVEPVFDALYGGGVRLATRTPASEAASAVVAIAVEGIRRRSGVVDAEVDQVVVELRRLRDEGETSVAVMSPFGAHLRAVERRVLEELTFEEVDSLDLRVATVHGMQGNERDVVLLSLGVGPDSGARRWRFIADPALSAVMLTRARRRLIVVHGAPLPPGSLLDRLVRGAHPQGRRRPDGEVPLDADELAELLEARGVPVRRAYPVGRHTIDLCAGDAAGFVGVICSLHPDGVDAHLERQLELLDLGWELVDALPSPWTPPSAELAIEIAARVDRLRSSPLP